MQKLLALAMFVMLTVPGSVYPVFAVEKTVKTGIVDVGNKICPVMGGSVSGKDFVEYNGKRYGLCCPHCKEMFLKGPEKYIAQMEAKEKV